MSLYRYKKYKKIIPISRSEILKNIDIQINDASMNTNKMKKFFKFCMI